MKLYYINRINSGKISSGKYSTQINDDFYFESNNFLYKITKVQLLKTNSKLDDSNLVEIPQGKIIGLFTWNQKLYLSLKNQNNSSLYIQEDKKWINIYNGIFDETKYIFTRNKKYLFFLGYSNLSKKNFSLFSLDTNSHIEIIYEFKNISNITNIFQHEHFLYVCEGKKPHRILRLHLFNSQEDIIPSDKIKVEEVFSKPIYSIISNDKNIFYCLDGQTEIINSEMKTVFSDKEIYKSGYQISACGTLNQSPFMFIGTWKRNKEHPFACFYILHNFNPIFKYIDYKPFEDKDRWTGYQIQNSSFYSQNDYFIPCYKSDAIFITKIDDDMLKNFDYKKCNITFYDSNFLIFVNTNLLQSSNDSHCISEKYVDDNSLSFPKTQERPPSRLYLTFDIEQHVKGLPYCITGEGLPQPSGLYWIMEKLEQYELKGIFFVNIYEHINYESKLIEKIIYDIDKRGHEVGLHCHPSELHFNTKSINQYSKEKQAEIILYGINFIKKIINKKPICFRAGAYVLNEETLYVLDELGIKIDSSLFMAKIQKDIVYKTKNKPIHYNKLLEFPITTHGIYGTLSKIDINWLPSSQKLLQTLQTCRNNNINDIVFMGHSFSFLDFTHDKKKSNYDFEFTGKRYIRGINKKLMNEFEIFLSRLKELKNIFSVITFSDLICDKIIHFDSEDKIPFILKKENHQHFCPICSKNVLFQPYRSRKNALCPICNSLERTRFKYLYLKKIINIENKEKYKILHIGPNLSISKWIKDIKNIDYISSDPYNTADFNFKIEDVPFRNNVFDLIICVAVLMHVLDDKKSLKKIYDQLKYGGELLLWLGDLREEITQENYDSENYKNMFVGDTTYPADLNNPVVVEKNGKIFYNPRYTTRIYGKDILNYLKKIGFEYQIIYAQDILINPEYYGIPKNSFLISCTKKIDLDKLWFPHINITDLESIELYKNNKQIILPGDNSPWTVPEDIQWNEDPFNNVTWQFYFHSLKWIDTIKQVYEKNNDFKYLFELKKYIFSWININTPHDLGGMAWYDHAIAYRSSTFIYFFYYAPFLSILSRDEIFSLRKSIEAHGLELEKLINNKNFKGHNHSLFHSLALYNIAIALPECFLSEKWRDTALQRMYQLIPELVDEKEGISLEQASEYHWLVLSLFSNIYNITKFYEIKNNYFYNIINKMLPFAKIFLWPDGTLLSYGNTPYNIKNNYKKNFYEYIKNGYKYNSDTNKKEAYFYIKNGYIKFSGANNLCIFIKMGLSQFGHGHNDMMSVIIYENDSKLLIDPGGPYKYRDKFRIFFSNARAHNTIIVNNEDNLKGNVTITRYNDTSIYSYVEGFHEKYKNVKHTRSIFFIKNYFIVIIDNLESNIANSYTLLYHFPPECNLHIADNNIISLKSASENSGLIMHIYASNEFKTNLVKGQEHPYIQGWVTPDYSHIVPAPVVESTMQGKNVWFTTIIKTTPFPEKMLFSCDVNRYHDIHKIQIHFENKLFSLIYPQNKEPELIIT